MTWERNLSVKIDISDFHASLFQDIWIQQRSFLVKDKKNIVVKKLQREIKCLLFFLNNPWRNWESRRSSNFNNWYWYCIIVTVQHSMNASMKHLKKEPKLRFLLHKNLLGIRIRRLKDSRTRDPNIVQWECCTIVTIQWV